MTSAAKTVAEFLEQLPAEPRAILEPLVETVRRVAPHAEGSMEFRMPTWKLGKEIVCALNSQKH